ncbi:MAG: TOBE domain-containing protein [Bacteroidales bacterium]|nr:TOBE domain-containing protein [Bacteroidales bacterium]
MKLSARNQIKGKVKQLSHGPVSTEVIIELAPGIEITSIITTASAREMAITQGQEAYAIIKASHVMLGVRE